MPASQPDRARFMRRLAGGLLVAMAGLLVVAHRLAPLYPGWRWVAAFAEAAMVGGLADWFAVTALFRHPLGLPIPHTAIIPSNKDRIAESMAGFLRAHFLTAAVVARRLKGLNFALILAGWLGNQRPGGGAARGNDKARLGAALREWLASPVGQSLGDIVQGTTARQLARVDVAGLAGRLLASALAEGRHRALLEAGLRWAGQTLEANEALLRGLIHERANVLLRWTGLDESVANALLDGLYRLLALCVVDPEHPLRLRLEAQMADWAEALQHDRATRAKVARWQARLLADPATAHWLQGLWARGGEALLALLGPEDGARRAPVATNWAVLGAAIEADPHGQALVNRAVRRLLAGLAVRHGAGLVTLVSETVKRWDAGTVSARIEGAVGRDLQFIRINGTLVGGLIGLGLYAVGRLLG